MVVLCAGLSVLWCVAPTLSPLAKVRGHLVRLVGCIGGLVTPLIATRTLHDLAINVAGLFSATAFVLTVSSLGSRAGKGLSTFSWLTLGLAFVNWLVWQTKILVQCLPAIQKLAFFAFLTWVVLVTLRVRQSATDA